MRAEVIDRRRATMTDAFPRDPLSPPRRRLVAALGAAGLTALLGACATPLPPPRPLDRARAPRVGDAWRYAYRSERKNVAPHTVDVTVASVTGQGIGDRLTVDGAPGPSADQLFTSQSAIVARVLPGVLVHEFSPYLESFGPIPPQSPVAVPPPDWGTAWSVGARVAGVEPILVPAGRFDATRVEIYGSRPFIQMDDAADPVWIYATAWFAPTVKRVVRFSYLTQAYRLNPLVRDHLELVSFRVG
jgi:hypothetical protein